MGKDIALHLDHNHQRHQNLAHELKSLGIELHKTSSVFATKKLLEKYAYNLFLIQFETINKQILDFYSFVRSENYNAIIIVLITKSQNKIEKQLFDYGVDDVVIGNPICTSTLTSRIKKRLYTSKLSYTHTNKIMFKGGIVVNFARRQVRLNGYVNILSNSADKLLRYFLNNPDRVITRDELLESEIWDMSVARAGKQEEGKAFDMAIGRLRKAIEVNPQNPQVIKTVYGKGWMLARDVVL
ncbi:MAG: winged helix-turn-helix domain-containing protein [Planctomycetota bacterium]|jgi:two-component system OmpR family response regulator